MTNKLMLAAVLALLSSAPALAQDTPAAFDSRWNPYLGCWRSCRTSAAQSAPVPAGTMVCVRPSGRFGVAVTTTVDGKNVLEQTIVADGSAQPLSQGDCSGTQTSNWSRDGERLFTRVELDMRRPAEAHRLGHHAAGQRAVGRRAGDGHRRRCRCAAAAVSAHERSVHGRRGHDRRRR